jgi:hypothetical protein
VARDDLLLRLQRNAVIACALLAMGAAIGSGAGAAAAVVGGGILAGVSFVLIKSAIVDATAFADNPREPAPPPNTALLVAKLTARYALLAFLAYVMIARLRLHPIGLIVGASSFVAVAAVEAARLFRNK